MASPMRPVLGPLGRPFVSRLQLSPPSVDLKIPLVGPATVRNPGPRRRSQNAA